MNLLVDIGNTRLKWAAADGRRLVHVDRQPRGSSQLRRALADYWGGGMPERIMAANVAGPAGAAGLADATRGLWGVEPELPRTPAAGHGLRCAYGEPWRMGVDRWAALVGAVRGLDLGGGADVVVVDLGTAVTLDVVAGGSDHLGGLIAPGLDLMRRSLISDTSDIATAAAGGDTGLAGLLGRDTRGGIQLGASNALTGMVEQVLRWLRDERGTTPVLVVTGGDAETLRPWLPAGHRHEPDLVLLGLAVMAEEES